MAETSAAPSGSSTGTPSAPTTPTNGAAGKTAAPAAPTKANTSIPNLLSNEKAPVETDKTKVEAKPDQADADFEELVVNKQKKKMSKAALEALREFYGHEDISMTKAELQKRGAGDLKLKEASKVAQRQKEIQAALSDPTKVWDVLKEFGHDPKSLAIEHLNQQIQDQLMTPEEKEQHQTMSELEELRAYKAEREAAEQAKAQEAEDAEKAKAEEVAFSQYEMQLIEAANAKGLTRDSNALQGLNAIGVEWTAMGFDDFTPDMVVNEYVIRKEQKAIERDNRKFAKLEGDKLLNYFVESFGDQVLEKLLMASVAKAGLASIPVEQPKPVQQNSNEENLSQAELRRKYGIL